MTERFMLMKTKQVIAMTAIALAMMFLAACSGGGGSGSPAPNGFNNGGRIVGGRIGGLTTGTYVRGAVTDGKVQLVLPGPNSSTFTALCQQTMDMSRGGMQDSNDGNDMVAMPNYANYANTGYSNYSLCTSNGPTLLTFHYDQIRNVIRFRFIFGDTGSAIVYEGQLQRLQNGAMQALGQPNRVVNRNADGSAVLQPINGTPIVFTGLDAGNAYNVTLSLGNQPNGGVLASGTMTPSSN